MPYSLKVKRKSKGNFVDYHYHFLSSLLSNLENKKVVGQGGKINPHHFLSSLLLQPNNKRSHFFLHIPSLILHFLSFHPKQTLAKGIMAFVILKVFEYLDHLKGFRRYFCYIKWFQGYIDHLKIFKANFGGFDSVLIIFGYFYHDLRCFLWSIFIIVKAKGSILVILEFKKVF